MCIFLKQYISLLWRKYGKPKFLLSAPLVLSVIYFEWFCYFLLPYQWPNINCGLVSDVHKILLVADPQILGEDTESEIARSDCDLFLKSTFNHAFQYVKPDLIIFLGDLMDEGSMAAPEKYHRYYTRFRNIFHLDYIPENQTIFLPGDNDIGGEDEDVTEYKVRRFQKHFPSKSDIVLYKEIKFFKVNGMIHSYPDVDISNDTYIRILLSHMPLLGINSFFGEQVISKLKPLLIFSAHDHKSVHLVTRKNVAVRDLVEVLEDDQSAWRFNLLNTGRVNEIVVPTSSYRMGVEHYGYGVALLGVDGSVLCYYTLWSPSRLLHLKLYLCLIPSTLLAYIVYYSMKLCCSRSRRETTGYKKISV